MIPPGGRDVQCSNCGTTWFQPGVRTSAPVQEPEAAPPPADDPTPPAPQPDVPTAPEPEVEAEAPAVADPMPEPDVVEAKPPPTPAVERPQRREIEPEVANILRQEAEREAELRRAEAEPDPVETQAEMPLDEAPAPRRSIPELEDAPDAFEEPDEAPAPTGSRGGLLPDIEEINSTLRATGDRSEGEDDATDAQTIGAAARRRGQVRRGFFLVVLLAAIAVLLYIQADTLSAAVPQVASLLDAYVSGVDALRFRLDDLARSLASQTGGNP